MIIAQLCLRLATIKDHSKMCSFTVLGWGCPKTSQYLVLPPFASCSATNLLRIELIRLLIVDCGMMVHSSSMAVRSCWILAGTGTRCHIHQFKHSQWVTCPVSTLAMQELGCFHLPGIVYRSLQHGAVHYHAATWGDGRGWMAQQWASGPRHGICAFKMPSIKCPCVHCPYNTPAHTMGHSIHDIDISKSLTHKTP